MQWISTMNKGLLILMMAAIGGATAGCISSPPAASVTPHVMKARVAMSFARRFDASKERTFRATAAALETLGYKVAFTDPERGRLKTAPKAHRFARLRLSDNGDFVPLSHALVISVREEAPGRSVVTGYMRTFSGEHETTTTGRRNEVIVHEMWSRLFAEVESDLE